MKHRIVGLVAALSLFILMVMPASATLSLQVSGSHLVDRGTVAVIAVTVACETGTNFDITVDAGITQDQGQTTVFGHTASSKEDVSCADGSLTTILTIHARGGTFQEADLASLQLYASTNSHDASGVWIIGDSVATEMMSRLES